MPQNVNKESAIEKKRAGSDPTMVAMTNPWGMLF